AGGGVGGGTARREIDPDCAHEPDEGGGRGSESKQCLRRWRLLPSHGRSPSGPLLPGRAPDRQAPRPAFTGYRLEERAARRAAEEFWGVAVAAAAGQRALA